MDVTVLVCTYNRCGPLRQALESIAASQMPLGLEWEILVVDNNSSDGTKRVVAEVSAAHPGRVRYVFEPTQGKSAALNTGLGAARGKIIAFTDDDVTVAPDWLARLTANLSGGEWAGACGRILPVLPGPGPRWLDEWHCWDGIVGRFDPALAAGEACPAPWGGNMAISLPQVAGVGGFRTDLGRVGRSLLSCEEQEFAARLARAGKRFRYEPDAVVHHHPARAQLTALYALRWFFGKGRSDARVANQPDARRLCGVPVHLFRRLAACSLRCALAPTERRRMRWAANTASILGAIAGSWETCRRSPVNNKTQPNHRKTFEETTGAPPS